MKQLNMQASIPQVEKAGSPVSAMLGKLTISALIIDTIFAMLLISVFALLESIEDASERLAFAGLADPELLRDGISYLAFPLILLVIGLCGAAISNTFFKNGRPLDKARWERFFLADIIGFSVALVLLLILIPPTTSALLTQVDSPAFLLILFAGAAFAAFLAGMAAVFLYRRVDVA
jgi:hypothetical protein